jgi:hypothetical protein
MTSSEYRKQFQDRKEMLAKEIGFTTGELLTKTNLEKSLFYPAGGLDFKPMEKCSKEIDIFIYVDVDLKSFYDLYEERNKSNLRIINRQLVTLEHVLQIEKVPAANEIKTLLAKKELTFSKGHFQTEPQDTSVGIYTLNTKNGHKRLFYILNDGYWIYLLLYNLGKISPKILYMNTGMMGPFSGGIPQFESEEGLKKFFKAKPGKIILG